MPARARTYDAPLDLVLPDLADAKGVALVAEPQEQVLDATYFDTPDRRLATVGVFVSRRTGGDDVGWHLDLPSAEDPGARHELRIGVDRAVRTVPKRFRSTVAGLAGDQQLSAAVTVTTQRVVRVLLAEDDGVLAEVTDDRIEAVNLGDDSSPHQWRVLDVALLGGGGKLRDRIDKLLAQAGADRTSRRLSVAQMLGQEEDVPDSPPRSEDAAKLLVQQRLAGLVAELRSRDPLVREGLPEGVHAMRVAIRRLRSHLATARPFLDRSVTDPVRDELSWLADALGEVRDAEVRRTRLDESVEHLVDDRPEVDWGPRRVRSALWSPLAEEHRRAAAVLAGVLTSERYAVLLDRLRTLVAEPPWTAKATKSIRAGYRRRTQRELDRLRDRMEAALDADLPPDLRAEALHDARKAAKRARYAVEPLRPLLGKPAERLAHQLKELQSTLGQHQDAIVTRDYLQGLSHQEGTPLDPAAVLTAGALIERESQAAEAYDADAAHAWRKLEQHLRLG